MTATGSAIRRLNLEPDTVTEVEFSHGGLKFRKRIHRRRRVADGEDPHTWTQPKSKCGAARHDAVNLDDGLRSLVDQPALAQTNSQRKE